MILKLLCAIGVLVLWSYASTFWPADWPQWPIAVIWFLLAIAIWKAPGLPGSKKSNLEYQAYMAHCGVMEKPCSMREFSAGKWKADLPYPVDVMAGYYRVMEAYEKRSRSTQMNEVMNLTEICTLRGLEFKAVMDDLAFHNRR